MKFENLIWVILFLVYMVFIFLKKTRAASKSEAGGVGKSRTGLKGKLDEFLSRIKAEIEAANPKGSDDVKPVLYESPPERIEPVIDKKPVLKVKPAPARAVSKSIKPVVDGKKTLPGLEYGIRDLRKAVIWSEILAPPLALRDD